MRFSTAILAMMLASALAVTVCGAARRRAARRRRRGAGRTGRGRTADAADVERVHRRGAIPPKFTQAGEQVSPQMAWADAPAATQSFVLHMHDMEGARNKTSEDQLHWLVWNIPATTRGLPEGVPKGDLKDGAHQTSASATACIAVRARRPPAVPSLRVRGLRARYEDRRCRQSERSVRHAREGACRDTGSRRGQGGVPGLLQAAAVGLSSAAGRCVFAVVGAGAFGGWTALHLRRGGAEVTAHRRVGTRHTRASSGGETRVIRTVYGPARTYVEMAARALTLWREWDRTATEPLYRTNGHAVDDWHRRQLRAPVTPFLRELRIEIEEIAPSAAAGRWPQISFDGVEHVWFEHDGGYLAARRGATRSRANWCASAASIARPPCPPSPRTADAAEVRLTDGTALRADRFVCACGPWLGELFPDAIGSRIGRRGRRCSTSARLLVTIGSSSLGSRVGRSRRSFRLRHPRQPASRVKIADDTRGPSSIPPAVTARPLPIWRARCARSSPGGFRRCATRRCSAPRCASTKQSRRHFIIDRHPAMPDIWIAGGGSGHGFKMGPALGEVLARAVRDDESPDPVFALARLGEAY